MKDIKMLQQRWKWSANTTTDALPILSKVNTWTHMQVSSDTFRFQCFSCYMNVRLKLSYKIWPLSTICAIFHVFYVYNHRISQISSQMSQRNVMIYTYFTPRLDFQSIKIVFLLTQTLCKIWKFIIFKAWKI